jgi:hypothetical protein
MKRGDGQNEHEHEKGYGKSELNVLKGTVV